MNEIVRIPFHGSYIHTARAVNGEPVVILKPTIEGMGLDWSSQYAKLQRRSWAVVGQTPTTAADGKTYSMASCGFETWSMLLANIDENKVKQSARDLVIAYQRESATALRDYWTKGGAINPHATGDQLDELDRTIRHARGKAEVLAILRKGGVVDGGYLDACGRKLAGQVMGETPRLDPQTRPLTVSMYLEGKDLTRSETAKVAGVFGKKLKAAYRSRYGSLPPTIDDLVGRHVIAVAQYQERHRDLFDAVWSEIGGA